MFHQVTFVVWPSRPFSICPGWLLPHPLRTLSVIPQRVICLYLVFVVVILFLYFVFVNALKYPVNLQKLPEEIGLGHYSLLHPGHQIKGSSLHQRLIVNRIIQFIRQFVIVNLIIDDNYNYLMVGAQIVVVNLFGRQFRKGCPMSILTKIDIGSKLFTFMLL